MENETAMQNDADLLAWCAAILGPLDLVQDETRPHPGERAGTYRLETGQGGVILKTYSDAAAWNREVHAYEHWAAAFDEPAALGEGEPARRADLPQGADAPLPSVAPRSRLAPRLLAARQSPGLAALITALPGRPLEEIHNLSAAQQETLWRSAGQALARFHRQARGDFFGPCQREGAPQGPRVADAGPYVRGDLLDLLARGQRGGWLEDSEMRLAQAALDQTAVFAGEAPAACHRDFCPANWLVDDGRLSGVIDFEFSAWDVRACEFARFPEWQWMHRPERMAAFEAGYAQVLPLPDRRQVGVTRVQYGLSALVWGMENEYFGFAAEGRQALRWLAEQRAI